MPRASWRGYLRLSLVSCPIYLSPARMRAKPVRLHQVWRPRPAKEREDHRPTIAEDRRVAETPEIPAIQDSDDEGDQAVPATRITLHPHDPTTGEEVDKRQVVKGYEYDRGQFVTFTAEELKALDIESSKVIDLETFVPRMDIDPVYFDTPYYVYPDGPIALETIRVIGAAMAEARFAGIGRLTLSRRERIVMVDPRGTGMALFTLRSANEVRSPQFPAAAGDPNPEPVAIAGAIIRQRTGEFDPSAFRDRYQEALRQLIEAKMKGLAIRPQPAPAPAQVIDLMAALKRSLAQEAASSDRTRPSRKKGARTMSDRRQTGLLLPLPGGQKRQRESSAEMTTINPKRRKKA